MAVGGVLAVGSEFGLVAAVILPVRTDIHVWVVLALGGRIPALDRTRGVDRGSVLAVRRPPLDAVNALNARLLRPSVSWEFGSSRGQPRVFVRTTGYVEWIPWFPWWIAIPIAVIGFVAIVRALKRATTSQAVQHIAWMAIAVLVLPAVIVMLTAGIPGPGGAIDLFHEGEGLAASRMLGEGLVPWKDYIGVHGPLQDGLSQLVGTTLIQDSRWGASAGNASALDPALLGGNVRPSRVRPASLPRRVRCRLLRLRGRTGFCVRFVPGHGGAVHPRPGRDLVVGAAHSLASPVARRDLHGGPHFAGDAHAGDRLPHSRVRVCRRSLRVRRGGIRALEDQELSAAEVVRDLRCRLPVGRGRHLGWCSACSAISSTSCARSRVTYVLTGGIPIQWDVTTAPIAFKVALFGVPVLIVISFWYVVARVRQRTLEPEDWALGALSLFLIPYFEKALNRADAAARPPGVGPGPSAADLRRLPLPPRTRRCRGPHAIRAPCRGAGGHGPRLRRGHVGTGHCGGIGASLEYSWQRRAIRGRDGGATRRVSHRLHRSRLQPPDAPRRPQPRHRAGWAERIGVRLLQLAGPFLLPRRSSESDALLPREFSAPRGEPSGLDFRTACESTRCSRLRQPLRRALLVGRNAEHDSARPGELVSARPLRPSRGGRRLHLLAGDATQPSTRLRSRERRSMADNSRSAPPRRCKRAAGAASQISCRTNPQMAPPACPSTRRAISRPPRCRSPKSNCPRSPASTSGWKSHAMAACDPARSHSGRGSASSHDSQWATPVRNGSTCGSVAARSGTGGQPPVRRR